MIVSISKGHNIRLQKTLALVKEHLSLDQTTLKQIESALMEIKNKDDLALDKAHVLSETLGLDFKNFSNGRIDYNALKEHVNGNKLFLPLRYQKYAKSKIRTITNVLDLLDRPQKVKIIKKLQLNFEILSSPERPVCGLLLMDLFDEICKEGLPAEQFRYIGYASSQKYKKIFLQDGSISQQTSSRIVYETAILKLDQLVEKNMTYQIKKINSDTLLLTATTRDELKDELHVKYFGTQPHCYNIMGWYEGILTYAKDKPAQVKKTACVHQGDSSCQYEISYSHVR